MAGVGGRVRRGSARSWLLLVATAMLLRPSGLQAVATEPSTEDPQLLDGHVHSWVVEVNVDARPLGPEHTVADTAKRRMDGLAARHNLIVLGALPFRKTAFHVEEHECHTADASHNSSDHGAAGTSACRLRRSQHLQPVTNKMRALEQDHDVTAVLHQPARVRVRRNKNDPLWSSQWYMKDRDFPSLQQKPVWDESISGSSVVVTIVDDGVDHTHPDLTDNFYADASYDFNDNDPDPMPRATSSDINKHGTRCGGVVASGRFNGYCGVGIAYTSRLGGIRMLDGPVSDVVEAKSLGHEPDVTDVYSCSWGPTDDGMEFDGPGELTKQAMAYGVAKGRHGLGSIYVFAGGNGGHNDDCNADGYSSSMHTISVNSVDQSGNVPRYTESCAMTLTSAFSSGDYTTKRIVTSDLHHKCTTRFSGTSAAAPQVAGILALALDANACLSWRHVQDLVVRASSKANLNDNAEWQVNGAGFDVSHKFGFGLLSASTLVSLAQKETHQYPNQAQVETKTKEPNMFVDQYRTGFDEIAVGCDDPDRSCIARVEHVVVSVHFRTTRRGALRLFLDSPAGTRSKLLTSRAHDNTATEMTWEFGSVQFWGEDSEGRWRLSASSGSSSDATHTIVSWRMSIYGTAAGLSRGPLSSKQNTVTLHNGRECAVCPKSTYPDGRGNCRVCAKGCKHGCFGPAKHDCLPSVSAVSTSSSRYVKTVETIFVSLGVAVLGAACLYSIYSFVSARCRSRAVFFLAASSSSASSSSSSTTADEYGPGAGERAGGGSDARQQREDLQMMKPLRNGHVDQPTSALLAMDVDDDFHSPASSVASPTATTSPHPLLHSAPADTTHTDMGASASAGASADEGGDAAAGGAQRGVEYHRFSQSGSHGAVDVHNGNSGREDEEEEEEEEDVYASEAQQLTSPLLSKV